MAGVAPFRGVSGWQYPCYGTRRGGGECEVGVEFVRGSWARFSGVGAAFLRGQVMLD